MARYIDAEKIVAWCNETFQAQSTVTGKAYVNAFLTEVLSCTTADVVPRGEVFEEVDRFRADLMNKFIDLCKWNDYNKLTLLKIGDVVDEIYDGRIADLKKKHTEGRNGNEQK